MELQRYFQELDKSIAENSNESIACSDGCSYCCHLHITVKPYELLPIVEWVDQLPSEQKDAVLKVVRSNCRIIDEVSDDELLLVNFTCPFLMNNSCSIYDIRPTSCRVAHSKSSEICEKAYTFPSLEIEADHIESLIDSASSVENALEEKLGEFHDVSDYNMNMALREALEEPEWITRYITGEEVFSDHALGRI